MLPHTSIQAWQRLEYDWSTPLHITSVSSAKYALWTYYGLMELAHRKAFIAASSLRGVNFYFNRWPLRGHLPSGTMKCPSPGNVEILCFQTSKSAISEDSTTAPTLLFGAIKVPSEKKVF